MVQVFSKTHPVPMFDNLGLSLAVGVGEAGIDA
jgi:hypothetical protein